MPSGIVYFEARQAGEVKATAYYPQVVHEASSSQERLSVDRNRSLRHARDRNVPDV